MEIVNDSSNYQLNSPAVSVIIPMYNVEKYINATLDSILSQTLHNFEVIAVDDCSTDLTCEIVESYIPKFSDRLKLYHTKENSGTAAVPRNMGFPLSKGEYVLFMDADDMFTDTALQKMYNFAKKFDADVVYCDRYYESDDDGNNLRLRMFQQGGAVDEPTLETEDMRERVQGILNQRYGPTPWLKLVRSEFLKEKQILFPILRVSDDNIWTQGLIFHAKRFLRIPDALYVFRMSPESITRSEKPPKVHINFWLKPAFLGLKTLDIFMSKNEFFRENPDCRHSILEKFLQVRFGFVLKTTRQLSADKVYEMIQEELGEYFGEYDVLIPALGAYICEQNKILEDNEFKRVEEYKCRISELEEAFSRLSEKIERLPAISVIIPMYNAEKYVSECLDSLLIQTFQDFEVIVIDDCSTDNSVDVVKSYLAKFEGRLKIAQTEENSGGGGYIPRTLGLKLAQGEYICFVDSDDFILASALETLYNAAKEYDAEVVYSSVYYEMNAKDKIIPHRDGLGRKLFKCGVEDKPVFIENNPHELFQQFVQRDEGEGNFHACWSKFIRRDFLLKNNITFLNLVSSGDVLWCINVYAHVKRLLRLPIPLYFYRNYNTTSVVRTILAPADQTYRWISTIVAFLKGLNELQAKAEFLKENPLYCQKIAEKHTVWFISRLAKVLKNLSNRDIYEILSNKFNDDTFSGAAPFLFNIIESERKDLLGRQLIQNLEPYITARIDILLISKSIDDDFKIISVSDDKVKILKPGWFQKDGIGYMIHSYAGRLDIIVESVNGGEMKFFLRGMRVPDPKNKSKLIPYWVDYTKFTIDGNIVFDKNTPVWHDKAYKHKVEVPAGKEIEIRLEWLPHRIDTVDVSTNIEEIQKNSAKKDTLISKLRNTLDSEKETSKKQKALIAELRTSLDEKQKTSNKQNALIADLRTALDDERKVHNDELELIRKFSAYFTARIDVKLITNGEGNFKITSVSDSKAVVKKARWLKKEFGYFITSYTGDMEIASKATTDGKIQLSLKGIDVRSSEDKSRRIPYWIDYTELIVNGKAILDKLTPAWHDKPYLYTLDVKANEEIKIQVKWLPHRSDNEDLKSTTTKKPKNSLAANATPKT